MNCSRPKSSPSTRMNGWRLTGTKCLIQKTWPRRKSYGANECCRTILQEKLGRSGAHKKTETAAPTNGTPVLELKAAVVFGRQTRVVPTYPLVRPPGGFCITTGDVPALQTSLQERQAAPLLQRGGESPHRPGTRSARFCIWARSTTASKSRGGGRCGSSMRTGGSTVN